MRIQILILGFKGLSSSFGINQCVLVGIISDSSSYIHIDKINIELVVLFDVQ